MSSHWTSLAHSLADVTVRATILLLVSSTIALFSMRASASFRHQIWTIGLIGSGVLPVLILTLPGWHIPIRILTPKPTTAIPIASDPGLHANYTVTMPVKSVESLPKVSQTSDIHNLPAFAPQPAIKLQQDGRKRLFATDHVLILWALGAIIALARLARVYAGLRSIWQRSVPLTNVSCIDIVARSVAATRGTSEVSIRIMTDRDSVSVPLTYGAMRPVIVLPAGSETWPAERLRAAILHEAAHIRRRDWLIQTAVQVVRSFYWFHPLAWIAAQRLRLESEAACDDMVLSAGMAPKEYAKHLLDVAQCAHGALPYLPGDATGAVTMAQSPKVEIRLRRILATTVCRREVSMRFSTIFWGISSCMLAATALAHPILLPAYAQQSAVQAVLISRVAHGSSRVVTPASESARKTAGSSTGNVTGKVVTPSGVPAPHAAVTWIERNPDGAVAMLSVSETDIHGQFAFANRPPAVGDNRIATLLAQAPGWGLTYQTLRLGLQTATVMLELKPSTSVHVSFIDETGKPATNVHVRVRTLVDRHPGARGYLEIPSTMHGRWEQKTDLTGGCTFPGLPQGATVSFAIDGPYAQPDYDQSITLNDTTLQKAGPIQLQPGASVHGQISLPDGKPVGGILVIAQSISHQPGGQSMTDASGRYDIRHLSSGNYNVEVYLLGELERSFSAFALDRATLNSGTPLRHDFVLVPGAEITGTVTNKSTGLPVAQVMIGIQGPAHPRSGDAVQSIQTDSRGVFHARVPAGQQYVYLQGAPANEYEPLPKQGGVEFEVRDGEVHTQNYALTPAAVKDQRPIHVRVIGPNAKPVAHAMVRVFPQSMHADAGSILNVETDMNGSCDVPLLDVFPGEHAASASVQASFGSLATEKAIIARRGEDVILQLKSNAMLTISGQAFDEKGRPMVNVRVTLYEWPQEMGMSTMTANTDLRGHFTFTHLFPDPRYSVSVSPSGYGEVRTQAIQHQPGKKVDLGELRPLRADSFVSGRVVDEAGNSLGKQTIAVQGRSTAMQQVVSDEQGRFRIDGVVREELVLYLMNGAGYQNDRITAQAGDTGVTLVRHKVHPN